MKNILFCLSVLLCLLSHAFNVIAQAPVKIACIGSSYTYADGTANREKNAYPAQLQTMLSDKYQVKNFGVAGTGILKTGRLPYWKTNEYKEALQFAADLVFIEPGIADTQSPDNQQLLHYAIDLKDLISSFRVANPDARVVLLLTIPADMPDSSAITEKPIRQQTVQLIQQTAYETGAEVVNVDMLLSKENMMPDKVHISPLGTAIISRRLYEVVQQPVQKGFDIFPKLKYNQTYSSFYGYKMTTFTFNNRECKVVQPHRVMPGQPWIWRARFWGHEPQTDIALLERGYHVVYCDASELFGNKEAVSLWNKYYDLLHSNGLAKKAAMEGMSRGGIYVYNWAAVNPDKVSCVYADNPVLDLLSWPGGTITHKRADKEWAQFKADYGFTTEEAALEFKGSPLYNVAAIVRGAYPMLHVVGDADDLVPVAENTALFEKAVKAAGGDITVIHKPGMGHHPHSLPNPKPIVDFILAAAGHKTNFAAIATPGVEYRAAAGWSDGKDWWGQYDDINNLLDASKPLDILMLGNSITQGTGGHRHFVTSKPGFAVFDSLYRGHSWESAGISGDRTQHVLWRVQHGSYMKAAPKVLVLTIGVNNFDDDAGSEIAAGIKEIYQWLLKNMPSTKVILLGPLPAGLTADHYKRVKYQQIQGILESIVPAESRTLVKQLATTMILENGDLNPKYYKKDGVHLTAEGYAAWAGVIGKSVLSALK
ncbi:GDSL-type esterase/lipase family protein [Chitinophaga sp. Hz27]|uniref:GDSL-type esterase/lipase family protein n=1 Tax=Chitinophaga sp. Hz27 TaxID=3347169 RepID=UPI0035DBB95C